MNTMVKEQQEQTWVEKLEWMDSYKQKRFLVKNAFRETDNYIGYIEMCRLKDEGKYLVQGVVRFNYLQGLPKITIMQEKGDFPNLQEAMNNYRSLINKIDQFIS